MRDVVPVILCGGSGTRLWPISRERLPKQFLRLSGNHSLLQETVLRAHAVTGATRMVTVTQADLHETLAAQVDDLDLGLAHHVLLEPSGRNTAAALGYAATHVEQLLGGGILWALASDHVITKQAALADALTKAAATARAGRLVTFGIEPTRPDPGLGYIREGRELATVSGAYAVDAFVEKPSVAVAEQYLAEGGYLWNSGMFVMDSGTFLAALARHAPEIHDGVRAAYKTRSVGAGVCSVNADSYGAIPAAPVDKAVMEKEPDIAVVPCDLGWSDIGSWQSLWEVSEQDQDGNARAGDVLLADTSNSIVRAEHRLVACAGLKDVAVIETADAVLVADRRAHQAIRDIVSTLKKAGRVEAERPAAEAFGWGSIERVQEGPGFTMDAYTIASGQTVAPPPATAGTETLWSVALGVAELAVDGQHYRRVPGESLCVDAGAPLTITSAGDTPLRLFALSVRRHSESARAAAAAPLASARSSSRSSG